MVEGGYDIRTVQERVSVTTTYHLKRLDSDLAVDGEEVFKIEPLK